MSDNPHQPPRNQADMEALCKTLQGIDRRADLSNEERRALQIAGFALWVVHFNRLHGELERWMDLGPITQEQQAMLRSLGIDPDE